MMVDVDSGHEEDDKGHDGPRGLTTIADFGWTGSTPSSPGD
jgi:hypothetical protein